MPRLPTIRTLRECITWYTNKYYELVTTDIRSRERAHIELIEEVNERYLLVLKKCIPEQYEEGKDAFIRNIDFLTQVFTKKRMREEKEMALQEFKNKIQGASGR